MAPVADRLGGGLDGCDDGQTPGVAQEPIEVLPLRFSLLTLLVGGPPVVKVLAQPIVVKAKDLTIQGRVIAVLRKY